MKPLHSASVSGLSDRNRCKFMKYIWKSEKVHNYITSEGTHHTWFVSLYQCCNQRFNTTVIWEGRKYGLADCMFGRECTWFTVKLTRYAHCLVCLVLVNKWKWICIIYMKVDLYHQYESGFVSSIYSYPSVLLHWHWGSKCFITVMCTRTFAVCIL